MATVTLDEIKTREAARRVAAADIVAERLSAAAPHLRGRFVLVGSYPEGRMRFDSDLDVIVDVPPDFESQAWEILEDACRALRLPVDILSRATLSTSSLSRMLARPHRVLS